MAHSVVHKTLGELNLSDLDLTNPADQRLWDSLYGKTAKGDLECLECREQDPGCPQWMFLRLSRGRPTAVHYSTAIRHASTPESPRHRALKERIACAAELAGFTAELEATAPDGTRRTDVLVHGADGTRLGCEIQLSYATAQAVTKRTHTARNHGLRPLWTTDDPSAPLIERTPWARIDRMPLEAFSSGNALLVRGGVKNLELTKCDRRNPLPCPDRNYGRCNQWHGTWTPTLGMHLDRLIAGTAANEYVPLYIPTQPGRRRAAHLWVTSEHRDRYLEATADTLAEPDSQTIDDHEPAPPENLPLSRACTYQERLGERRGRGLPRDTAATLPAGITLTDPPAHANTPRLPQQRTAPPPPSDCPPDRIGPCRRCHQRTHRYGPGGNPLCPMCRAERQRG